MAGEDTVPMYGNSRIWTAERELWQFELWQRRAGLLRKYTHIQLPGVLVEMWLPTIKKYVHVVLNLGQTYKISNVLESALHHFSGAVFFSGSVNSSNIRCSKQIWKLKENGRQIKFSAVYIPVYVLTWFCFPGFRCCTLTNLYTDNYFSIVLCVPYASR
jgi:hypothetical protein